MYMYVHKINQSIKYGFSDDLFVALAVYIKYIIIYIYCLI